MKNINSNILSDFFVALFEKLSISLEARIITSLLIVIFANTFVITAQDEFPDPPTIKYVSVIDSSGNVKIEWIPNLAANVDGYIIFYYDTDTKSRFEVDTIEDKTTSSAIITNYGAGGKSVEYVISSYFKKNDTLQNGIAGKLHKTIFLQAEFDTCSRQVNLSWNRYKGWEDNLSYDIIAGNNYLVTTNDTFYNHSNINVNESYQYYVRSISTSEDTTKSNRITYGAFLQKPPDYIYAHGAEPNNDNNYDITFQVAQPNDINVYFLQKNENEQWINVDTASNSEIILLNDEITNTQAKYRLQAIDVCGETKKQSNVAAAINLEATIGKSIVELQWNDYEYWLGGVKQYRIFRNLSGNFEEIDVSYGNAYTDNLSEFISELIGTKIYYYIIAEEEINELNIAASLKSNTAELTISPDIYAPEAFTPNDDGINDLFLPKTDFHPLTYHLIIYTSDRYKVFETDSYAGWNGANMRGEKMREGGYIYYVEITSPTGQKINRYGQIFIVYP